MVPRDSHSLSEVTFGTKLDNIRDGLEVAKLFAAVPAR